MAVIFRHFLHGPHCSSALPPSSSPPRPLRSRISCSSSQLVDPNNDGRTKFKAFPYVSAPQRNLMVDLVSTVEDRLDSQLRPCTLPPDVRYYENQSGTAHASLHIRSGQKPSKVDFMLGSWIHSELPTGGALNITSLSAYLNSSTDAPNFLLELILSSPTSLILILDLPPRKELVLYPDYLRTFYEDTQLDRHRQNLEKIPEVRPFVSSSLYIRSQVSPTAIMVRIETEASGQERMEEVIRDYISPIAKEMLGMWLDQCVSGQREVAEADRAYLERRDGLIKSKTLEVDLGSSFPRLFGPQISDRVLGTIREYFTA